MEENKNKFGKKLVKLLSSRGFYILLALGLAVVGVSGYVSNTRKEIQQINEYSKNNQPTISQEELAAVLSSPIPTETPASTEQPELELTDGLEKTQSSAAAGEAEEEEAGAETVSAEAEPPRLMLPLQGEMTADFSGEDLIYSKTMEDWRVHSGVDIRADKGTQVKAAADGVVASAAEDGMTGFTVVLQHEGGLETVYANLQSNEVVKEGQTVEKGDVIGGVGDTAVFEIAEAPHLHFEVKLDGNNVDPFEYMD
jgi:murein DD-endopeptidase MepM/ murein hydrolase activator NlpD